MSEQYQIANGLRQLFRQREAFILFGLTGRTGSGCTTSAQLLTKTFAQLNVEEPRNPPQNHEERKFTIIYEWSRKHWKPFTRIAFSDVIAAILARENWNAIKTFLQDLKLDVNIIGLSERDITTLHERIISIAPTAMDNPEAATENEIDQAYKVLFDDLPNLTQNIRKTFAHNSFDDYVRLFQTLGDNIRRSGRALDQSINPEALFTLPQMVDRMIAVARCHNKKAGGADYYVIDAFRHPYEAQYFRERYAAFSLIAVATDESDRRQRLQKLNLRAEEIDRIDKKSIHYWIKHGQIMILSFLRTCKPVSIVLIFI